MFIQKMKEGERQTAPGKSFSPPEGASQLIHCKFSTTRRLGYQLYIDEDYSLCICPMNLEMHSEQTISYNPQSIIYLI